MEGGWTHSQPHVVQRTVGLQSISHLPSTDRQGAEVRCLLMVSVVKSWVQDEERELSCDCVQATLNGVVVNIAAAFAVVQVCATEVGVGAAAPLRVAGLCACFTCSAICSILLSAADNTVESGWLLYRRQ